MRRRSGRCGGRSGAAATAGAALCCALVGPVAGAGGPRCRVRASLCCALLACWAALSLAGPAAAAPVAPAAGSAGGPSAACRRASAAARPRAPPFAPLVFVHVPKTAGASVAAVLQRALVEELGCAQDALSGSAPPPPPGARCVWAHALAGPDGDDRTALAAAATGAVHREVRLDFLMGHVPFGVCPLLNASGGGCDYTTVLRHPLDRLLSHYGYLLRRAPHIVLEACAECATIEGFAEALAAGRLQGLYLDDLATRLISGDAFWQTFTGNRLCDAAPASDTAMLARAKFNLAHHFSVIGFTDRLDEYLARVRGRLGLPPTPPAPAGGGGAAGTPRMHEAPPGGRLRAGHLAPETRAALLRAVANDVRLYEFARRLVRRRGGA
jgi:hypothetical protein